MSEGFRQAGFHPVFAVESDPDAAETYRRNFGYHLVCSPIEKLPLSMLPTAEVIIGGPPCQGFSQLGKHLDDDPRNQLWHYFLQAVAVVRPLIFVMENVPQILNSAEYEAIKQEAGQLGYSIAGDILNAADFGVSQRRKRAIIIGSRIGEPIFPTPTYAEQPTGGLLPWRTVRQAIGDLPLQPTSENLHIGRNPTATSRLRYQQVPEGGNRFDLQRKRPDLTPGCWIRKQSGGTDLFGRLWWDKPAFTIRTEFFKPEKGRYLHPQADRPITHREAARLQTFPDDFIFSGSKIEIAKQIGNAVPCLFARAIAASVRSAIEAYQTVQVISEQRFLPVAIPR
ncbi:MAG: DNA (cytosine-5-)-methyltransferase [Candidatus Chloroheliales bacterium]|nr:MAG: DNA (cytosine-5-)-methyltransferase [Chloroflexota bacterium]